MPNIILQSLLLLPAIKSCRESRKMIVTSFRIGKDKWFVTFQRRNKIATQIHKFVCKLEKYNRNIWIMSRKFFSFILIYSKKKNISLCPHVCLYKGYKEIFHQRKCISNIASMFTRIDCIVYTKASKHLNKLQF